MLLFFRPVVFFSPVERGWELGSHWPMDTKSLHHRHAGELVVVLPSLSSSVFRTVDIDISSPKEISKIIP
jgi:hypothetical protein